VVDLLVQPRALLVRLVDDDLVEAAVAVTHLLLKKGASLYAPELLGHCFAILALQKIKLVLA
jgi:hypothetical protein